ncbi:CDP-glycerol glycerophosphotransferase family protein [uncultured Clostridium sp.]|uniref:CDP-glycerol glycerophosphotransferase family protein n=1 Tax=uncultured Clostridium sp. TaxID=59620 RepID=UPI0008228F18|nr:CDP-glycerol glycerophosphotransferase family protein [uncultured Clostridium sp.]SCJ31546.1 CDP-glycerol:poly(glycerophosphate) glycerophosphotransferase [uncultured Clostridium sp.]
MNLIENILILEGKNKYKTLYIDINNILVELEYESGAYKFNFNNYEKNIFEELYFNSDKICCKIYSDKERINTANIANALEMIESKDNKYRFILFNDNNKDTNLHIEFTESFKKILMSNSNNLIKKLNGIKAKTIYSGKSNDEYLIEAITEDMNGNILDINNILNQNNKHECLYKLEIIYKKRGEEILYSSKINTENGMISYVSNICELCKENNLQGFFDLYIRVISYKNEKRIRIKAPYIEKNMVDYEEKKVIDLNSYYNIRMYYTEDSGISFKINKITLKYKANVIDVNIDKKNSNVIIEIDSNFGDPFKYKLIEKLSFEIRKRNSSLNLEIFDYEILENKVIFILNNKKIMDELLLGIWDGYINIKYKGQSISVRAKNYSEIKNKKDTLILSYIYDNKNNKIVKPYYTLDDDLSFEVNERVEIKKVNYIELSNKKIHISANMKILKDIGLKDNNYKINLYMISADLSKKFIECKCSINKVNGHDYNLNIISDEINNSDTDEFKNKIYTEKLMIDLQVNDLIYNLNINADYTKIFIDKIDKKIQDENYKIRTKLIYKFMCKLLPIKKGLVVFQSFGGRSYSGNPKYIYKYANSNYKNLNYVWALRNQFEEIDGNAKKVKIESLRYYYYLSRAEYIVSNLNMQDNVKKRKGAKFIQTWHGTPLKKISFDVNPKSPTYDVKFLKAFKKRVKKWDCLLAQNEYSIKNFRSAFKYNGPIHEVGHALNDVLIEQDKNKIISIKKKLNINSEKKVLLYAPTWRDNSKYVLDIDIEKMYSKLKDDYILLVKTHYFVNTSLNAERFKGFVYDVSKYEDIQELALISDILITDYSSVMFDFATTKKPMIFYCHDINYYKGRLRGFYFDFENEAPGKIVKKTDEIITTILNIDKISKEYEDKYQRFYDKFAYLEDGKSSRRACATIFSNSKKKKIHFLSFNIFGMGGTGRTVINTAESLIEKGYEVELISIFGDKNDQYFEIDKSIEVSLLYDKSKKKTRLERILNSKPSILINKDDEFYSDFSLLTDIKIIQKLIRVKRGIVVSTRPGFNIMIAKFFKLRKFKVIGQEHLNFNIHTEYLQKQIKKYYSKLDLIMTLTDADTIGYTQELPKCKNKIVKIPNAIPRLEITRDENKNNQIIAAGRLVPQKGFDLLIKSAPKIIEKHPDWTIKIFGKGRDNQYLKNLIIENNVEKNVFLMGPSKTIEREMQKSKIYALSSRYEGFGMVIVEAMKMEIPVVSFDCPEGPGEIITHNNDGILVENGNIDEFANQINRLIEDEELRDKLVRNAKQNVKRYNSANIITYWIESLNNLK